MDQGAGVHISVLLIERGVRVAGDTLSTDCVLICVFVFCFSSAVWSLCAVCHPITCWRPCSYFLSVLHILHQIMINNPKLAHNDDSMRLVLLLLLLQLLWLSSLVSQVSNRIELNIIESEPYEMREERQCHSNRMKYIDESGLLDNEHPSRPKKKRK